MKTTFPKVLAYLTVLMMLFTMVPAIAFAETDNGEIIKFNSQTFPDDNFRNEIKSSYPSYVSDEELTQAEIKEMENLFMPNKSIANLKGIEHLTSLETLNCANNNITNIEKLPDSLKSFNCSYNKLATLPALPAGLTELVCNGNSDLSVLPSLPEGLKILNYNSTKIVDVVTLPATLEHFDCGSTKTSKLPATLPNTLKIFRCSYNKITNLPDLPKTLTELSCGQNSIKTIPALPEGLEWLDCSMNKLEALPALPESLKTLYCHYNSINGTMTLPPNLKVINCSDNNFTALSEAPNTLETLSAANNEISGIVDLSRAPALKGVSLQNNNITGLMLCTAAKYDFITVKNNCMNSTADIINGDRIIWDGENFVFDPQKSLEETCSHKFKENYISNPGFMKGATYKTYCSLCGEYKVGADREGTVKVLMPVLSATKYTYNGKVKKPTVTVKTSDGKILKEKVDYDLFYSSGRKNVGTYKVDVALKGKYSGTTSAYFTISPKAVAISKLTKGKKALAVKWKKPSSKYLKQMTGYEIRYSLKSSMKSSKTVTVKSAKTTSKTIKKLKQNKKYYVQIRTYKTVKGSKIYSSWSSKKSVKTK